MINLIKGDCLIEMKKLYPKCTNLKCKWNMKDNHKSGYEYLDKTCYYSSEVADKCKEKNK